MTTIEHKRYRTALCPYLAVGNRRILVHVDAFGVPQSLQWPQPGSPDRLAWRDPLDEWPYWDEVSKEAVRARMPYIEYADGTRDCLHDALDVSADYIDRSNVLEGRYVLPGGAIVGTTTFVPPGMDVWVRHYEVSGRGKLVLQSEFFEKAVRGHSTAHLGTVNFRGAFDGAPRGVYVIMSTLPLTQKEGRVEVPIDGKTSWTLFMCMADDIQNAVRLGEQALARGYETLKAETVDADRAWVAQAKAPVSRHPFVARFHRRWLLSNYLHLGRDGAMTCGPRPFWGFAWPRDCSHQAAAFAAAGFMDEARSVVEWHLGNTPESGVHEARYCADRRPMLLDNRPRQGDNPGMLCWSAGFVCQAGWDRRWAERIKEKVYRMADHLVTSRDAETLLPLPAADHRETQIAESLGVAVSAVGGLNGAAHIAGRLGDDLHARRYLARADEIRRGMEQHLWNEEERGFNTSIKPVNTRADIAICWGVYPFRVWKGDDQHSVQGVARLIRNRWNADAGGVLAGSGTPYESFWFYYTAILLLGVAGIGDGAMEAEILNSLETNVSPQGLIPEQIGRATGQLWGCAPLPVAQAELLLYAYRDRDGRSIAPHE